MSKIKALVILAVLSVVIGAGMYVAAKKDMSIKYSTEKAEKGSLTQTVSETGSVKSINELDLSFLNTGQIARVYHRIGDSVMQNALLAELDYAPLITKKEEAAASLDVAREKYNKLISGSTEEEIAVARATVQQRRRAHEAAKKELEDTRSLVEDNILQARNTLDDLLDGGTESVTAQEQKVKSAETTLQNTKTTYQNSIDNKTDAALTTMDDKLALIDTALDMVDRVLTDDGAKETLSVKNSGYLTMTRDYYDEALLLQSSAQNKLLPAESDPGRENVGAALFSALAALNKTFDTLQSCFNALEASVTSSDFTLTELNTHKTNISAQITAVAAAVSSVQSAKQNLDSAILDFDVNVSNAESSLASAEASYNDAVTAARNALSSAESSGRQQITLAESKAENAHEAWQVARAQLEQTMAPANKHDLSLARAQIRQAQASLNTINKQIENSKIYAPINGKVTKVEYEPGEQIAAGVRAISLLVADDFEIEVLVSEADIAKIEAGDPAEITLDAYGEDVRIEGEVIFIEPAETVIQEVIYYKVKVGFQPEDLDIKSGMTANVVITTAQKDEALIVPSRAIIEKNGSGKFVRVLAGQTPEERPVTTGLRGDGGRTEIISGVAEGEMVVTYIEESN